GRLDPAVLDQRAGEVRIEGSPVRGVPPELLAGALMAHVLLFLPAQVEAVRLEGLLDFLDRLLSEVRDRGELVLALRHEVADRLDADALEAAVRAHTELQLLHPEGLHPVRERLRRRPAGGRHGRRLAAALPALHAREHPELASQ